MTAEMHPKGINIIGDSASKVFFSLNSPAPCTWTNLIVGVPLQVSPTHLDERKNQSETTTPRDREDRKKKTKGVTRSNPKL